MIFYIAALAECNRPPFDLAEADGEIVAGFHTEYGGLRYAMFANAEFVEAITPGPRLGAFLGGWQGPVMPGPVWMLIKMLVILFTFIWVRATVPRLRYDRLMQLGWKVLLPIATLNLLGAAGKGRALASPAQTGHEAAAVRTRPGRGPGGAAPQATGDGLRGGSRTLLVEHYFST